MLTELCKEIRNWFEKEKFFGYYTIDSNGIIIADSNRSIPTLQEGQYFRIIGSIFNDGVYKYESSGVTELKEESFKGSIWALAIPKQVVELAKDIEDWSKKYETTDSNAMAPFSSESFGGYSYSKYGSGASSGGGASSPISWRNAFASRLNMWRKI